MIRIWHKETINTITLRSGVAIYKRWKNVKALGASAISMYEITKIVILSHFAHGMMAGICNDYSYNIHPCLLPQNSLKKKKF